MATIPLSWSATAPSLSSHLPPHFTAKPPHFSGQNSKTYRFPVSCNKTNGGQNQKQDDPKGAEKSPGKLDRRNVLFGMGGLYSAANLVPSTSPDIDTPISSPDFTKCTTGTNLNTDKPLDVNCCPPVSTDKNDYKLPPVDKMRVRPAAHLAGEEYYAKFEKAIGHMRALPADDPRTFMQQANVHCAYCNLTYEQNGDADVKSQIQKDDVIKLQIHNCWLFFPWHRWYLYFYERILGHLINDPTFALPFWNYDHPDGMPMPERYARSASSLYDAQRNQTHLPPALMDLAYSPSSPTPPDKIILNNLAVMYNEIVGTKPKDFYGATYVTGTPPDPGPGTVERGSHTAVHVWTGQNTSGGEDMGNFYSAGRDTLFFAHHANVDRLWTIWRNLRGSKQKDFPVDDRLWLDAKFLFYDENKQLVRVAVKDTVENEKMGYVYQERPLPWLNNRPTARVKKSRVAKFSKAPGAEENIFPVKLDKVVKVLVSRPKKSRSKKDKEKEDELLVIEGIEVDTSKFVKFDVFVNDEDDKPNELDKAEYAGCYSQVPHKSSGKVKTKIRLGLTELLEDLDAEDDEKILVTLVPKAGGEYTSIGGIKIIYD